MTPTQLAAFIKMTTSASVRSQIQEESPEGWELQIGAYEYKDCVLALRSFLELMPPEGTKGPWINASDIKGQVRDRVFLFVGETDPGEVDTPIPGSQGDGRLRKGWSFQHLFNPRGALEIHAHVTCH